MPFDVSAFLDDGGSGIQYSKLACEVRGINQRLCDCARWVGGNWTDVGQDRSVPYGFDEKISVAKGCPRCNETGIMQLSRLGREELGIATGPSRAYIRASTELGSEYYIG